MPGRVNVVSPTGEVRNVAEGTELGSLIDAGWTLESSQGGAARAVQDGRKSTAGGKAEVGVRNFLKGLTFGLSQAAEVALDDTGGNAEHIQLSNEAHPDVATGGEYGGIVAQTLIPGAGAARGVGLGVNAGERLTGKAVLGAIARTGARGAAEGAAQGGGDYLAQSALEDKPRSVQGFLASMGNGALWGGAAGTTFGVAEHTLSSARRLWPVAEVTGDGAKAAERKAAIEITSQLDDATELERAGRARVRDLRKATEAADPAMAAHLERVRLAQEAQRAGFPASGAARDQADAWTALQRPDPAAPPKAKRGRTKKGEPALPALPAAVAPSAEVEAAMAGHLPTPAVSAVGAAPEAVAAKPVKKPSVYDRLGPDDEIDMVLSPADLADRIELPGANVDPVRVAKARKYVKEGLRPDGNGDPIRVVVHPDGRYEVTGGRHRIAAALEEGKSVPAKVSRAAPTGDALLTQLAGTAKRLEGGESFSALNAVGRSVDDHLDDAAAKLDPKIARAKQLADELAEARKDLADAMSPKDYAAKLMGRADEKASGMRAAGKLSRDADVLREVDEGGSILGAKTGTAGRDTTKPGGRGVRSRLRDPYTDDELIAQAAERPMWRDDTPWLGGASGERTNSRTAIVERILSGRTDPAMLNIEELIKREVPDAITGEMKPALGTLTRRATSKDILDAVARSKNTTPDAMAQLRAILEDQDVSGVIAKISRVERAEHNLVQELGALAPTGSQRRSQAYAQAVASHGEMRALGDAQRTTAITEAAKGPLAMQAAAGKGLAGTAADAGAALEVLATLGVPGLPSARDIPYIGPILSMYLKARAGVKLWKKAGGRLPGSVEGKVAERSARARERLTKIVHASLDGGAAVARSARKVAPRMSVILAAPLFKDDDGRPSPRATDDMAKTWAQRSREIEASQQPGAIQRALQNKIRTSDPALLAELVSATERKIAYLASKMPRPPLGVEIGGKHETWRPGDDELDAFAQIVEAVDQPLEVLERATYGDVSLDAIDAIKAVYPDLYADAQTELIEAASAREDISHGLRSWLSILFDVPLDPTQYPDFLFRAQELYALQKQAREGAQQPQAGMGGPPQPSISAPIHFPQGALLQEQR